MKQGTLFGPPILRPLPVRRTDPATSEAAAASIASALPQLEQEVLAVLRARGAEGATTHELSEALGIQLVSISPRIAPLRERGLVRDSGARRKGDSGRASTVWRIA